MNPANPKRALLQLLIGLLAAGPMGGFLLGLFNPGDPDSNPIGRIVYSFMLAVQAPLHAGFPPHVRNGTTIRLNAWPHIAFAFLLIFGWLRYRDRKAKRSPDASTPSTP